MCRNQSLDAIWQWFQCRIECPIKFWIVWPICRCKCSCNRNICRREIQRSRPLHWLKQVQSSICDSNVHFCACWKKQQHLQSSQIEIMCSNWDDMLIDASDSWVNHDEISLRIFPAGSTSSGSRAWAQAIAQAYSSSKSGFYSAALWSSRFYTTNFY